MSRQFNDGFDDDGVFVGHEQVEADELQDMLNAYIKACQKLIAAGDAMCAKLKIETVTTTKEVADWEELRSIMYAIPRRIKVVGASPVPRAYIYESMKPESTRHTELCDFMELAHGEYSRIVRCLNEASHWAYWYEANGKLCTRPVAVCKECKTKLEAAYEVHKATKT